MALTIWICPVVIGTNGNLILFYFAVEWLYESFCVYTLNFYANSLTLVTPSADFDSLFSIVGVA